MTPAPGPDYSVRDATIADLPGIVAIYNETIPGRIVTADLKPVTVAERLSWFERHTPARRPLWVAASAQGVLGWLSFESFYGRPAYDATVEVSVYVAESARRRGIGRDLLDRALTHAPVIGVKTLLGFVFAHNVPSLELFGRAGFTTWGHYPRVAELDGIERDLVIVGRRIAP